MTALPDNPDTLLAQHAVAIRNIGKRVMADIIEIGGRLTECKKLAGHGGWLPWLDREFGWTEMTATRYMNVYELGKSNKLLDLDIPVSGLYLLAAPSTPEAARAEVLDRAKKGEKVAHPRVKEIVAKHKTTKSKAAAPAPAPTPPKPAPAPVKSVEQSVEDRKAFYAAEDEQPQPKPQPELEHWHAVIEGYAMGIQGISDDLEAMKLDAIDIDYIVENIVEDAATLASHARKLADTARNLRSSKLRVAS